MAFKEVILMDQKKDPLDHKAPRELPVLLDLPVHLDPEGRLAVTTSPLARYIFAGEGQLVR